MEIGSKTKVVHISLPNTSKDHCCVSNRDGVVERSIE